MKVICSTDECCVISKNMGTKHISMNYLESHGHYEIYFLMNGERNYFIDDAIYHIESESIVIVPPQVLHRTIGDKQGTYSRILLNVPQNFIDDRIMTDCLKNEKCLVFNIPLQRRYLFERLFENMEYEYGKKDKYSEIQIKNYIYELIVLLIRLKESENFFENDAETDKYIGNAARYIRENFEKKLTLDSVADKMNMSKSYFCKLFKKKTGFGFADYLAGVRITEGAKLLTDTRLSVTEIAMRCGYNDSAYFTAVFKKIKGVTPIKYRKNYNG